MSNALDAAEKAVTSQGVAVPTGLGVAAISNPIWFQWISTGWSVVIAILGFGVLVLTFHNKWMEAKRLREEARSRK